MFRALDHLTAALGFAAGWAFFAAGLMIAYEVAARYLFNAPTIWAAELSEMLMVWGTFIAMAVLLRRRQHIRITVLTGLMGRRGQHLADAVSLAFIAVFSGFVAWHGGLIALDSFMRGRSTGTMMNLPNWWTEIVLPIGFALLALQAAVELLRLARGEQPPAAAHEPVGRD